MTAPILEIVKKLEGKKFLIRKDDKWRPQSIPKFIPLPIKDMIIHYKVILLQGFLNYYSFVDNRKHLAKIYMILKESLRKTICRKRQIGKRAFERKFGPNIEIKIRRKDGELVILNFKCPNLKKRARCSFTGQDDTETPLQ